MRLACDSQKDEAKKETRTYLTIPKSYHRTWRSITNIEVRTRYRYAVSGALKKAGVQVHKWRHMLSIFQGSTTAAEFCNFLNQFNLTKQRPGAQCEMVKLRMVCAVLKAAHEYLGNPNLSTPQTQDEQSDETEEEQSESQSEIVKRLKDESKLFVTFMRL